MSQPAINVGSKVKITRVRDRIPADLVKLLLGNSEGTVTGFKMTDGSGVGVKVKLEGGQKPGSSKMKSPLPEACTCE